MVENLIKTQISSEDARKLGAGIERLVERWHSTKFSNGDICPPDYIFLTETSSIPYGFAIKEAWKRMYPNEKRPKFYRIDPVRLGSMSYGWENSDDMMIVTDITTIQDYFDKRIRKENAKIIIFEEEKSTGLSLKLVKDFFINQSANLNLKYQIETKFGKTNCRWQVKESEHLSTEIVEGVYYCKNLHPELKKRKLIPKITGKYETRTNCNVSKYEKIIRDEIKKGERDLPQRFTGFTIHGEEMPYARQFIQEMKNIGRRVLATI